jgi:DNA-directed RNA polymerase subunit RPC12/RpoP
MGEAYKCDICGAFFEGHPVYKVTIMDVLGDPRDKKIEKILAACKECGDKIWKKSEK